ncbi:hypothetical protein NQ318_019350 [Aromia moschata]|uniref:Ig-like domain-containing protein n=1 Tax=Aromia moschata TaxID=1265417 RepID=A0AAV8YD60_9CUCU|nr:hypothetical protein NQ318_019350 [Aromia moschata]
MGVDQKLAQKNGQKAYAKIEIVELNVPHSIEYTGDETNEIVLDCNYDTEGETLEELEVIWYHNGVTNPIYQWIPFSNRSGDARGWFRSHLDLEYNVSDDKRTMYRALKLTNITTDLTGNYTCRVSSLKDEDDETKQLIVYSRPQSGIHMSLDEEEEQVVCSVEGVYPVPDLEIYIAGENDSRIDLEEHIEVEIDDVGFFNVTATHIFENLTILKELNSPVTFVCRLSIPGTNYNETETKDYYTGIYPCLIPYY